MIEGMRGEIRKRREILNIVRILVGIGVHKDIIGLLSGSRALPKEGSGIYTTTL